MTFLSRVLCAVDFSPPSKEALDYACQLAEKVSAELVVVHALDRQLSFESKGEAAEFHAELREKILRFAPELEKLDYRQVLHSGEAGKVICWVAQQESIDLIIMGTHGRTGLAHMLFGSAAEFVLQHARCPVLTIRPKREHEPELEEPSAQPLPAPRMM